KRAEATARRASGPCPHRLRLALELLAGQAALVEPDSAAALRQRAALGLLRRIPRPANGRRPNRERLDGLRQRPAQSAQLRLGRGAPRGARDWPSAAGDGPSDGK